MKRVLLHYSTVPFFNYSSVGKFLMIQFSQNHIYRKSCKLPVNIKIRITITTIITKDEKNLSVSGSRINIANELY
jgi:hypothetical protein